MNMSWGALPRITALAGPSRAKQLAIFCEPCPADEALAWGMVDEVVARRRRARPQPRVGGQGRRPAARCRCA